MLTTISPTAPSLPIVADRGFTRRRAGRRHLRNADQMRAVSSRRSKQCASGTGRLAPALLPFLQGPDRYTQKFRKPRLGHPVFARILTIAGTLTMRPCSPRLSWRMPSRISPPMSRVDSTIDLLPDLPHHGRRDTLNDVLRIDSQHPDFAMVQAQEGDQEQGPSAQPAFHLAGRPRSIRTVMLRIASSTSHMQSHAGILMTSQPIPMRIRSRARSWRRNLPLASTC